MHVQMRASLSFLHGLCICQLAVLMFLWHCVLCIGEGIRQVLEAHKIAINNCMRTVTVVTTVMLSISGATKYTKLVHSITTFNNYDFLSYQVYIAIN